MLIATSISRRRTARGWPTISTPAPCLQRRGVLETRLPLLFSEGVGGGRIDLNQFVALTATGPAKLYGLYPRKGTIAVGSDADLVVWDRERRVKITNDLLHHAVDYTPYEGMEVTGWPRLTLSRGEVVFRDGELTGARGRGQFLACDRPRVARA